MRRSLAAILVLLVGLAASDELFEGAKVKPVKDVKKIAPKVQVAQDRQDSYGAPVADPDSYGPPQAPVVDDYSSPLAPPEAAPAPVQGDVGTQGYYYYYYPVANSQTQTYQSSAASESSGGGLLGGIGLPILIVLGIGVLVVLAVVFSGTSTTGRSLTDSLFGNMDTDELMYQVYHGIELWNQMYD